MEEARRVLARLERIEALDRERVLPQVLLTELRALLVEAEAWARADPHAASAALDAVQRCREALSGREQMPEGTSRTLLA